MPIDQDALDRLRRLRSLGVRQGARDLPRPQSIPRPEQGRADQTLPGELVDTPHGPAWICTTRYPLSAHGELADLLNASPAALAALGQDPGLAALEPGRAAFIDTETTGLSLGTGTYTFLIGIGTYEAAPEGAPSGAAFVVRQFFMRSPADEHGQLHLVEMALNSCTGIVSFNGRAFDWPLLYNRFTLASLPPPLPGAPHLDLLPPARRIWRARFGSCALGELERRVLEKQRTEADVPGWMIPSIYHDYYRSEAGPATVELISRVFYHNLEDIISMVLLAARMAPLFDTADLATKLSTLHPIECASLARCYEALSWRELGEHAYRTAMEGLLPEDVHREILRNLAELLKRSGRRAEAADLWETWITTTDAADLTPYVELAKYHEWHTGDLTAAHGWVTWALHIAESSHVTTYAIESPADLHRRLDRIVRKLTNRGSS